MTILITHRGFFEMSKICKRCNIDKKLSDYRSGFSYCKSCHYEANKAWRKANPEKHRQQSRDAMRRQRSREARGDDNEPNNTAEERCEALRSSSGICDILREDPNTRTCSKCRRVFCKSFWHFFAFKNSKKLEIEYKLYKIYL